MRWHVYIVPLRCITPILGRAFAGETLPSFCSISALLPSFVQMVAYQQPWYQQPNAKATEPPPWRCNNAVIARMASNIGAVSGRRQTYREVLQASYRLACSLQRLGLQPGDLVGVRCGLILEFLVTALAVIRAGCTLLSIRGETLRERLFPPLIVTDDGPRPLRVLLVHGIRTESFESVLGTSCAKVDLCTISWCDLYVAN
ncbi:hypothetical protein V5799_021206 [Amblyomma americanum]|uniref:AMP-dependent synthetase/ligase domain-containing protein n=1 Tax=Amblyomma americanum TaxID=6943 RepID=A0AAQ4FRC7_AMBAM